MAPIKVGILGYGFASKSFHLPFIRALPSSYTVTAILQRAESPSDPSSAAKGSHCTVDFPDIKHYRKAEDFFADAEIDFVVVATHADTHALFAEQAMRAGKNVIVDKPFARSTAEADSVIKVAKETGRIVTCFQNRRWDGDFLTLRALLENSMLGTPVEAIIHYDFDRAPWLHRMTAKEYTPGSGHLYGLGTHSLDQAFTLFGRPAHVTAFLRSQRAVENPDAPSAVEDSFTVILQYGGPQKDLLVTVKTAVVSPMDKQLKYWIRGTKSSYTKCQQRSTCPQEESISANLAPTDADFAREDDRFRGTLASYEQVDEKIQSFDEASQRWVGRVPSVRGRWMGLYENVAGYIRGEGELEVKVEDVRDVLRCIELARESSAKGMTVAWR
ncbi:hypothetical protein DPSP01_011199 [Paraphaeosphaeria sporulosa]